jgi:hypothetical protein
MAGNYEDENDREKIKQYVITEEDLDELVMAALRGGSEIEKEVIDNE